MREPRHGASVSPRGAGDERFADRR
jgi:hypothetical protein